MDKSAKYERVSGDISIFTGTYEIILSGPTQSEILLEMFESAAFARKTRLSKQPFHGKFRSLEVPYRTWKIQECRSRSFKRLNIESMR